MSYTDDHEDGFVVLSVDVTGWEQIAYFENEKLKDAYIFAKSKLKEYNKTSKLDASFVKTVTIKNIEWFDMWSWCQEKFGP